MPDLTTSLRQGLGLAITRRFEFRGKGRLVKLAGLDADDLVPADLKWVGCVEGIEFSAASPRDYMLRALFVDRTYQDDVLIALRHLLRPGDTLWDVGANYGFMSLYVDKVFNGSVRTLAFEPSPVVLPYLQANLDRNHARSVQIESMCLSDSEGTVTFYFSEENSWNATLIPGFAEMHGESERIDVDATTLDKAVARLPPPSVIKLDVEGAEHLVLAGGHEYLSTHRPPIVAEYNLKGIEEVGLTGREYLALYEDLGYRAHLMPRRTFGRHRWKDLEPLAPSRALPPLCNLVMLSREPR